MPSAPLDAYSDDDDLPVTAAAAAPVAQPAAKPRDPSTGQFLPQQSAEKPQVPEQPAAPTHTHSSYMLRKAAAYGIAAANMDPETLGAVLAAFDTQQAASAQREATATPQVKAKADEPPAVDWGEDDDGKPLTEASYTKPIAAAIKAAHRLQQVEKENADLKASFQQDRQERQARQAEKKLNAVLASRPDLFGDPNEIAPNSIEAHRRQAVVDHLNRLVGAKQHTTLEADAAAALAMFGPATGKPAVKPVAPVAKTPDIAAAYRNGELARPSGKRGTELLSRRAAMIEQLQQQQRDNGSFVSTSTEDDDADLPDPKRG